MGWYVYYNLLNSIIFYKQRINLKNETPTLGNVLLCVGFSFVMPFGKYKGSTLFDISEENPSYIKWLDVKGIYKIEDELLIKCLSDTMSPDSEDLHSD
jgi:uncharacterized protein (DUF3820 family)